MSESAFDSEMYKRIRGSSAWSPFTMSPSELVTRAFSQQFSLRFNIVGVHVCDNYSVRCFHGYRHRYNGGGGGGGGGGNNECLKVGASSRNCCITQK